MSKGTKLLLRRADEPLLLHPADPVSEDYVREIARGNTILATVWTDRNKRFHGLAMSWLHQVLENNDTFDSFEDLMRFLAIETGLYTMFTGHDGQTIYRLQGSIAFDEMDEVHFRRWMNRVEYVVAKHLIQGLSLEEHAVRFKMEAQAKAYAYWPKEPETD